jgi:hypothetical protein
MVRLISLTVILAVAIGANAASAQTNRQADSKAQSISGVVKAVFASSLTLEFGGKETKFAVDRSTRVFAKGSTLRDLVGRPDGRPLTDFVKVGDQVTVRYRQSGISLIAVEVRVAQK